MDTRHKQLHDRANDLFSRQQYQQAAELFTQALQQLATSTPSSTRGEGSSTSQSTPQQQQQPTSSSPRHSNNSHTHHNSHTPPNHHHHHHHQHRDLHLSCLNKRATCLLKLDQNEKALDDINKLLAMSPTRSSLGKLLMRKTQALSKLNKTQEAYETAKQWTSAEPKNGQASKEVNRLKRLLDEKRETSSTSRSTSARDKNGTEASSHSSQSSGRGQGASGGSASSALSTHHQRGKRKAASEGKHKRDASKQENPENFCSFCQVQCSTQVDYHLHSMSESHRAIISSDEGRDWKHRPPPRGAVGEEYLLCADRLKCRFGQQCTYAHSEDELAEWKERYRYRQMKYQRARDKQIHGMSFAEQLFEKWMNSPTPLNVLSESVDDVKVSINSDSNVTVSSKNSAHSWIFTLHCKPSKQLQRVALFFDVHRPHFSIASILMGDSKRQSSQDIPENCQEWSAKMSSHNNNNINPYNSAKSKERIYRIKIQFTSQIFGTFRQSVVFDFGTEPVLMKRISVDSVSAMDQKELEEVRESMLCVTERWDGTNKTVVNFDPPIKLGTEQDKGLLSFYVPPHSTEELFKRSVLEKTITKNNYKNRMHDLLYIEETARFRDISKFNIRTTLQMATTFMLVPSRNSGARYAQSGQLFALMRLTDDLSDDTPGGRLILNSCNSVFLAPVQDGKTPEKVYEAPITEKSKDSIYLTLSKQCVDDLKLKNNSQIKVELQFQLNRLPLCEMHYAVDKIPDMSLLFPDVHSTAKVPWTPNKQWSDKMDMQMNSKQREAIVAMTTPLVHQLPPIFLVGPYGTGKTYTLAHATRLILQQPNTRILICTHSNSAADLYIRDYFHSFVESGNTTARPLRIYFKDRWVPTVHPVVRLYCCMSEGEDRFVMPTKEQVEKHRVVVATLSTSRFLTHLELEQGYFTHILLDEAAQAMECETVMPLALATKDTRIVLAGDYMQISPQVHSEFVFDRRLHISLLERLYDHYPDSHPCKILLCANYRSHEAIVDYTSDLFYDGKLLASGKQPPHPKWYPLTYFTARGEDVQEKNSISFYNNAEVFELCDRVQELQKMWPEEWGTCDENSIGVVAHYSDQVFRIRHELRKRKLFNVSVERVMNVQGKQFRALFISTVRTHHTCKHVVKAQPSKKSASSSKSKDPPPQSSSEDEPDYGFLSNDKLLNTAITRAQSLVAVVGDPISACSIGKCRKLWEKFISMCNDNNSLHGCTFSSIQNQLSNVEMKKTYVLNPLAKEFIPRGLRNQMMGAPFIQGSPPHGLAAVNHNLHRSVLSPSHTPTPPIPGNQPLPFFGGVGAVPAGGMVRPASPVPFIDPYTGRRVLYVPMMHMPVPIRMVHNPYYHPFPHYPYMDPAVPYHPQFMHQGGFMIPQGMKHGPPGSPALQPAQDKSQGPAAKEAPTSSSSSMHPGGPAHRIPPGSPARDPRPMSLPIGQYDTGSRGGNNHERQEVVAKIEEMQINEEYQYLLRTRGQNYADNFLANVKRSQSPKVTVKQTGNSASQNKVSQQQHQGQRSHSMYAEKTEVPRATGQQPPFSNSINHWNTSESNQPDRDPWPTRTKSHNPRDTLDSSGNQPRIRDPAIIDQGPAFSKSNPPRIPFSPLDSTPPNVFVDTHMPPYRDHEAKHQREFSVQPSDLSPRTPANFMEASPGLSPLELAIQLGDAKGSFLGKGNSFSFNGTSPLASPRDDPNHLAPPSSQKGFGHQSVLGQEHTFRPVSKDDRSSSPHSTHPSVGHQRWPQSSMSNNFSSTLSSQHQQQEFNSYPQSQGLQNFSPTTPSLSSQESLPSPSSPYSQGSTSNLLGLSTSPANVKDDSKPLMSYASALRAPPKPKVRAQDERTKTASPDPLSLIKDLGNRQTKDGFYSIF